MDAAANAPRQTDRFLSLSNLAESDFLAFAQQALEWIESHPAATGLLVTLAGAVCVGLWWLFSHFFRSVGSLYGKRRDRLRVQSIVNSRRRTFREFVDLYHDLFDEQQRVATSEIAAWVDGKRRDCGIGYRVFLARMQRKPIGFGIVMFNEAKRIAYVPYVGLGGDANRWNVSKEATSLFFRKLERILPKWQYVVVELDDPDSAKSDKSEYSKRRARLKLFKEHCSNTNLDFYLAPFQYVCPPYHTDAVDHDIDTMQLGIITRRSHGPTLSSSAALAIIDFLYTDIYINCIWRDAPDSPRYIQDTNDLLQQYRSSLALDMTLRPYYVSGYDWSIL